MAESENAPNHQCTLKVVKCHCLRLVYSSMSRYIVTGCILSGGTVGVIQGCFGQLVNALFQPSLL